MTIRCLLALLVSMAASPALAWTTEALTITGGTFTLSDSTTSLGAVPVFGGLSNNLGDIDVGDGVVDVDGLYGSAASPVTTFQFMGVAWNTFFAHSVETTAPPCNPACSPVTIADPEPGPITVTGTPYDPVITADFSGFFTEWNGNLFWQGGQATGTASWIIEPPLGATFAQYSFTLHWSLLNQTGPFEGFTSDWVLTGTATAYAVPEPATWAMMLAGLGLVAGGVRRRRMVLSRQAGAAC